VLALLEGGISRRRKEEGDQKENPGIQEKQDQAPRPRRRSS